MFGFISNVFVVHISLIILINVQEIQWTCSNRLLANSHTNDDGAGLTVSFGLGVNFEGAVSWMSQKRLNFNFSFIFVSYVAGARHVPMPSGVDEQLPQQLFGCRCLLRGRQCERIWNGQGLRNRVSRVSTCSPWKSEGWAKYPFCSPWIVEWKSGGRGVPSPNIHKDWLKGNCSPSENTYFYLVLNRILA